MISTTRDVILHKIDTLVGNGALPRVILLRRLARSADARKHIEQAAKDWPLLGLITPKGYRVKVDATDGMAFIVEEAPKYLSMRPFLFDGKNPPNAEIIGSVLGGILGGILAGVLAEKGHKKGRNLMPPSGLRLALPPRCVCGDLMTEHDETGRCLGKWCPCEQAVLGPVE